jgi:hypothetical protein
MNSTCRSLPSSLFGAGGSRPLRTMILKTRATSGCSSSSCRRPGGASSPTRKCRRRPIQGAVSERRDISRARTSFLPAASFVESYKELLVNCLRVAARAPCSSMECIVGEKVPCLQERVANECQLGA